MLGQRSQTGLEKSSYYLPAVLRPTEPPKRVNRELDSPPSSPGWSNLSLWRNTATNSPKIGFETKFRPNDITGLSLQKLGAVTGPPTRVHWKPDLFSAHCDLPSTQCKVAFTTFRRRHHCRRCGLIFCHLHSLYSIPLDQDANFHPYGTQVRACENCWIQWNKWIERQCSAAEVKKPKPVDVQGIGTTILPRDYRQLPQRYLPFDQASDGTETDELSQSVPRDWNWSTF